MARAKKFAEIRNAETGEPIVQFMGPAAENDALSMAMRMLTQQLISKGHGGDSGAGGFFGGTYGYGVDFENDVFEMHPDWQGDCSCGAQEPIHSESCRAVFRVWLDARNEYGVVRVSDEEREAQIKKSVERGIPRNMAILGACSSPWDFQRVMDYEDTHPRPECVDGCPAIGWTERDECEPSCRLHQHCFTFKPSGFVLDWYKYIGRDMEVREQGTDVTLHDILEACLGSIGVESLEIAARDYEAAENESAQAHDRAMKFWMSDEPPAADAVARGSGDSTV